MKRYVWENYMLLGGNAAQRRMARRYDKAMAAKLGINNITLSATPFSDIRGSWSKDIYVHRKLGAYYMGVIRKQNIDQFGGASMHRVIKGYEYRMKRVFLLLRLSGNI